MNKKYISLFIIGILMGAAMATIYLGNELDELYVEIQTLEHDLQRSKERADRLEEELQQKEQESGKEPSLVVQEIDIVVDYQGDDFTRLYIQEYCEEKTSKLLGQEVSNLEPELVFQILDERLIKLEEDEYKLFVNGVVVAENIVFHIEPINVEEDTEI